METLREGSRGADVISLQRKLAEKGFSPGAVDGDFGPGTEAAVLAFQQGQGLLADGIVGAQTAQALGFEEAELPPTPGMPNITVTIASKMVPGAPLGNISANLPLVMDELNQAGLTAQSIVLAAIATVGVETGRFEPISEFVSRFNTSPGGELFDLYDFRTRDLGNDAVGDGARYKGRGFVQLTGKSNYQHFGQQIGVDLVADPEQANEPRTAAKLLAAFLKAQELRIKQALAAGDFATARRAVNGGTFGLDQFTRSYQTGERLLA